MADTLVARPGTTEGIILPPLPESQLPRPSNAPGRQLPGDGSHLQASYLYLCPT